MKAGLLAALYHWWRADTRFTSARAELRAVGITGADEAELLRLILEYRRAGETLQEAGDALDAALLLGDPIPR